ncbi:hypothetical protein ElyMa_003788100 [Elysia marginata]|uniref:LRRK2 ARM repeat domain-containing protein n=1 Tax=Elysia marginata TaxID=1093978 RepID=A0AAV4FB28_9GAST|nr:hypothetical protein ElyMa_003788100 [Elysia marginata]
MKVILTAMNTFKDNSQIHRCCCKVIAVVSLSIDIRKNLDGGTTLESVLCSMKLFQHDLELQIIGCGTLACLLEKTGTLRVKLIEQGGITLIGHALSTHQADSRLAVVAVMALDHLMPIDQSQHAEDANLAKETILKCMRTFSENKEVQISGCKALGKLDISTESDVIEIAKNVTEAIRRHGREPEVQKSAAAALRPYYKLGFVWSSPLEPYSGLLDKALHSPSVTTSEYFWRDLNQ